MAKRGLRTGIPTEQMFVRVPVELKRELKAMAALQGKTLSDLVLEVLTYGMSELNKD